MTRYLLDRSVLSAFAPGRPPVEDRSARWLAERDRDMFFSVVSVSEVEEGVAKLRRVGSAARAGRFAAWLDGLIDQFERRVLVYDLRVARVVGQMSDRALAIGRHPGFADVAIAATAKVHGLTVLTRNTRHFEPLGIDVLDPFVTQP